LGVELQYLGWSCFLIQAGGKRVLVDPHLAGYPESGVQPSPLQVGDLANVDAVCVTHAAADHYGATSEVALKSGAIVCGGIDSRLRAIEAGVPEAQTAVLVSGATYQGDGWSVKALEAKHISFSQINGAYLTGQPLCYLFDFDGVRIFHGGDTSISTDFQLFGELYRPQVAIVGVDGVLFGGRPIVELDAREAAFLVQMLGAQIAIPMHYRPESGQADAFLESMRSISPQVDARKLEIGETMTLGVGELVA